MTPSLDDRSGAANDAAPLHPFDRDTDLHPLAPGRYGARIDSGWFIVNGPNGGYLAGLVLRAMSEHLDDPESTARTLTIHYLRAPREGPAELELQVLRQGRSMSTVTAALWQGDRQMAHAIAAFSKPRGGVEFQFAPMLEVPPPEDLPRREPTTPMAQHYDVRYAPDAGPEEGGGSPRPFVAGWIRPDPGRAIDAPLLAAYADALPPPAMVWRDGGRELGFMPTIDLTVHFRGDPTKLSRDPEAFHLAVFRSRLAGGGYVEEDGEIWSREGELLAHSRQLALIGGEGSRT